MAAALTVIHDQGVYGVWGHQNAGLKYEATLNLGTYATGGVADNFATLKSGATATSWRGGTSSDAIIDISRDAVNNLWQAHYIGDGSEVANAVDLSAAAKSTKCEITYTRAAS